MSAEAARPAGPPPMVAELAAAPVASDAGAAEGASAGTDHGRVDVVLTGDERHVGKALAADPAAHVDPVSTLLTPKLEKGDAIVWAATGYRLSTHDHPGDTVVTYTLLLETPIGAQGAVKALWWENHQEVPTSLYVGDGTLAAPQGGAQALTLRVKEWTTGDELTVSGIVRIKAP